MCLLNAHVILERFCPRVWLVWGKVLAVLTIT